MSGVGESAFVEGEMSAMVFEEWGMKFVEEMMVAAQEMTVAAWEMMAAAWETIQEGSSAGRVIETRARTPPCHQPGATLMTIQLVRD